MPQNARDGLFDHLADCYVCGEMLGELLFTETTVGTLLKRPMQTPAAIRYNVLSAISRETARPVATPFPLWSRFAWRPVASLAAAVALAFVGVRSFNGPATTPVVETPRTVAAIPAPESAKPVVTVKRNAATPAPTPVVKRSQPARTASVPRPAASTARPIPPPNAVKLPPSVPAGPGADVSLAVGIVTLMTGSVQERVGNGPWQDFLNDSPVLMSSRLRSAADTMVTLELNDGSVVKSNSSTEFAVLRSPSRDDPYWVIRLIHGEVFVSSRAGIRVEASSSSAHAVNGDFSVRSLDGDDVAVVNARGQVRVTNEDGSVVLASDEGTSMREGVAPASPFYVDVANVVEWAFRPADPLDPLDTGGTQS